MFYLLFFFFYIFFIYINLNTLIRQQEAESFSDCVSEKQVLWKQSILTSIKT